MEPPANPARFSPIKFRLDSAQPGLDLVEKEVDLVRVAQALRAPAITSPLQRFEDRMKPSDPSLGLLVEGAQFGDLPRDRKDHRLQRFGIVGQVGDRQRHRWNQSRK